MTCRGRFGMPEYENRGGALPPPSCNESRHSPRSGNLHKWVQDSILRAMQ